MQPPCQVLHFIASLGLRRKGLSQWGNKASKMKQENITVPHPQYLQPQPRCCFSCWLLTLHKPHVNSPPENCIEVLAAEEGSPLSALQALTRHLLDSSIPSNHAVLTSGLIICHHSSIHPPYHWGHLPWLSWRHLSCFDFLSWQHRAVLFLACLRWEDWEMALRPSALLCCGAAVAAAVWPPRFIHEFFLYF